jgi:GNAT superfamily N-acetyltransferase
MSQKIIEVRDKAQLAAFIRFPWQIYRNEPNWVAPLLGEEYKLHNFNKHPFWKHAKAKYYLAVDKGKVLGRIAAIYDPNFISFQKKNWGYWGFFECIENQNVANSLFKAASSWLKERNIEKMIGPMNPSTNYSCGLLINGFDSPPCIMMTYNLRYYPGLVEGAGLTKAKDLLAWTTDLTEAPERLVKLDRYSLKKWDFTIRKVDFSNFESEVESIYSVYNKAWELNWGFVPFTRLEFEKIAKDLKVIADKDILLIAESKGKPVGFSMALPDINQALSHLRSGRLFPFGIFKLLHYRKKINKIRVLILGVMKDFRNKGIVIALCHKTFVEVYKKNYTQGESSWILEDNIQMNSVLKDIGARIYKIYRMYEKTI